MKSWASVGREKKEKRSHNPSAKVLVLDQTAIRQARDCKRGRSGLQELAKGERGIYRKEKTIQVKSEEI